VCAWDPVDGKAPDRWDTGRGEDSPSMAAFRAAAQGVARPRGRARQGPDAAPAHASQRCAPSCSRRSIRARRSRMGFGVRMLPAADFEWSPPDPLEPVMAHPEFPQPMFRPLAALSPDWILPGLFDVPADRVTLASDQPAVHRGVHGRVESRVRARAALARVPVRSARQLLPAVLGAERRASNAESAGHHPVHGWEASSARGSLPTRRRRRASWCSSCAGRRCGVIPGTLVYAQRATMSVGRGRPRGR
jgi:hypothetical protein